MAGFAARLLFKDGKLRETAKALLREIYLEDVGGDFGDVCWSIPGSKRNPEGYRYIGWAGRTIMGHRLAYELFNGPIPDGHFVLHACDNPPCCNPRHLRTGTPKDNSDDLWSRGGQWSGQAAKTHCRQGHSYDAENTLRYRGHRYCRACQKIYKKRYHESNKHAEPKERCGKGHLFTPENTYLFRGRQQCKECHRMISTEWARKRRAQAKASKHE